MYSILGLSWILSIKPLLVTPGKRRTFGVARAELRHRRARCRHLRWHGQVPQWLAPRTAAAKGVLRGNDRGRETSAERRAANAAEMAEEMIVNADIGNSQKILPEFRQATFDRRARRHVGIASPAFTFGGRGSAARSTLPFARRGSSASVTNDAGIMALGSSSARRSRSSHGGSAFFATCTRYATRYQSPSSSRRAVTTAWSTESRRSSACSISPTSMRWPRIFT